MADCISADRRPIGRSRVAATHVKISDLNCIKFENQVIKCNCLLFFTKGVIIFKNSPFASRIRSLRVPYYEKSILYNLKNKKNIVNY